MEEDIVEYQNKKVVIKSVPKNGDNLAVYVRPGDEIDFELEGLDLDLLEYQLIGGDIVVAFPDGGMVTFASMALMGYSASPPVLKFGSSGSLVSVDQILSAIEEVNELPIESVNASFQVRVSEDKEEDRQDNDNNSESPPQVIILTQHTADYRHQQEQMQRESETERYSSPNSNTDIPRIQNDATTKDSFTGFYSRPPSQVDLPEGEYILKPEVEMAPKNDFISEEEGFGDGYGDSYKDGDGNVDDAAKPAFYFKATAHQVKQTDPFMNDDGILEVKGGGGSLNGYKFDSISNQFESETIDMSNISEDMVIRAENNTYFSNTPQTNNINKLTFQPLENGESVTVDGLTLTATADITADEVAAGFANLAAEATQGNAVANGNWSGALSSNWSSGDDDTKSVTFSSTSIDSTLGQIDVNFSAKEVIAAPNAVGIESTQGDDAQTELHKLEFQDLIAGQSVTVDGLTLTATDSIAASDVAAGFASLAAEATQGNAVANGNWSGALSSNWSSGAVTDGTHVSFTSVSENEDVEDIAVSTVGSVVDVDIDIVKEYESVYLSRVLRFEPQMPEGFYVDNFQIEGLPSGIQILDKENNAISGSTISKDQMIFKDALGNIISTESPNFLTQFKSAEFIIKYNNDTADTFNLSITANYKVDSSYLDTIDIDPSQTFTNEYTISLQEVSSTDDYNYKKSDFANGKDEGFVFSENTNTNIIKLGSGNTTVHGGIVKDIIYDGAGDDTIHLNVGDDTVYGGSGINSIFGETSEDSSDTVSYELVQSFSMNEIKLLESEKLNNNKYLTSEDTNKLSGVGAFDDDGEPIASEFLDTDMLTSYKGVYVDLDGITLDKLETDLGLQDGATIHAISKFANREDRFTYDEDGYAVSTTIGKTITFTSKQSYTNIDDLSVFSTATKGSDSTQAVQTITLSNVVLKEGETYSLKFGGTSLTTVALGEDPTLKNLIASLKDADGYEAASFEIEEFNGKLQLKWKADGEVVQLASLTQNSEDEVIDSAVFKMPNITVQSVQGSITGDEKHTIAFDDMHAGQSLTVGGLTLYADEDISARDVAAGFANLSSGATSGNAITGGSWSGEFSDLWSVGAQEQPGLENIQSLGYDILEGIENINGSRYNDTLYGNDNKDNILSGLNGNDLIWGRGGDNTLLGGDGYDTLISGSGNDFIDGGADTDTVSYQELADRGDEGKGIVVRLDRPNGEEYDYSGWWEDGEFIQKDIILNVEDVIGSKYHDTIFGSGGTNFIQAGDGDDSIFAGGGYNFVDGGAGSDWMSFNPKDYPDNAQNPNYMQEIQGISINLNSNDFVMVREVSSGRLTTLIKLVEEISGTEYRDTIWGSNRSEVFWGHGGNDYFYGRGGNNTVFGGEGNDVIRPGNAASIVFGGDDPRHINMEFDFENPKKYLDTNFEPERRFSDTIDMRDNNASVNITLNEFGNGSYARSNGVTTYFFGFENINATNSSDIVRGNAQDNILNGLNGNDTIYGVAGNNTINGGNDNDIIYGGSGDDLIYGHGRYNDATNNDVIDGGGGNNTLNYSSTSNSFELDFTDASHTHDGVNGFSKVVFTQYQSGSYDKYYDDLVKNFNTIIGGRGNDVITANDSGMYLDGWSGKDTLIGGDGDDTIVARNTSGETLDGGDGTDTLFLAQDIWNGRSIDIENFEILDLDSHRIRLNNTQFTQFDKVIGDENSILYLYGTGGNDSFDFTNVDFSEFEGTIYSWAYGGDDSFDFTGANFDDNDMDLRLDGSSGTDALILDGDQMLRLTENYFNTFENFDISADSALEVDARNDGTIYFHNNNQSKDFTSVDGILDMNGGSGTDNFRYNNSDFTDMSGVVNMNGGAGNDNFYLTSGTFTNVTGEINMNGGDGDDTFYLDFTALSDGKLKVDGGDGSDMVDVRTSLNNDKLVFNEDMFTNIERLEIDQWPTRNNNVEISAQAIKSWMGDSGTFTLDIANNTQGQRVKITDTTGDDITNFQVGSSYTINIDADDSFALHVV